LTSIWHRRGQFGSLNRCYRHHRCQRRLAEAAAGPSWRRRGCFRHLPARRHGKGANHNVFFVTTSYGKTIAVGANGNAILGSIRRLNSIRGLARRSSRTVRRWPIRNASTSTRRRRMAQSGNSRYRTGMCCGRPRSRCCRQPRRSPHRLRSFAAALSQLRAAIMATGLLTRARGHSRRKERQAAACMELAVQRRRVNPAGIVPVYSLGDLGLRRGGDPTRRRATYS
jgi:hypothetical protein